MKRTLLIATLNCLFSAMPLHGTEKKPNVILIRTDDLGYEDIGFQDSDRIKTPHLDRLIAAGGCVDQPRPLGGVDLLPYICF